MSEYNDPSTGVPSAPYPPLYLNAAPKSAMSISPMYSRAQPRDNPGAPTTAGASDRRVVSESSSSLGSDKYAEADADTFMTRSSFPAETNGKPPLAPNPAQIQFFPANDVTFACINSVSSFQNPSSGSRSRRLGPVLLEMKQLEVPMVNGVREFRTATVGISRGNPQLGTSVASTCLDLPKLQQNLSGEPLLAATGLTTGMLAIHNLSREEDVAEGSLPFTSSIELFHASRHHRQASAVAWREGRANHIAIGLLGSVAGAPSQQGSIPRRGGSTVRGSSGDREFCCFLWDIEAQHMGAKRGASPLSKISHNTPVASLEWVLNGQTLAVGTQAKNIQLYDMRSGTNAPPLSALAHTYGVHGIEVNPHKSHVIATYSRAAGEPVKVWDIRRMDAAIGEIKVVSTGARRQQLQSTHGGNSQCKIEAIKWSKTDVGVLSIATGETIQDYDTLSHSRPTVLRAYHSDNTACIKDFALYGKKESMEDSTIAATTGEHETAEIVKALYPRRMLCISEERTIFDMPRSAGLAPVDISTRDGRVVHTLGSTFFSTRTEVGPSAMEKRGIELDEDISVTMIRRGKCSRKTSYSMDTQSNIAALSHELRTIQTNFGSEAGVGREALSSAQTLLRLWSWIERVEGLADEMDEADMSLLPWVGKNLLNSGIKSLLEAEQGLDTDVRSFSDTLQCDIYDDPARRQALTVCGWAGKYSLSNVLAECESLGELERSAALAVWHGELGSAIDALQRAAEVVRSRRGSNEAPSYSGVSPTYAETLDLAAMCIAGFSGAASTTAVWRKACLSLLQRDDLQVDLVKTVRSAYLRTTCYFLLDVAEKKRFENVLENDWLSLGDRIAFACLFLSQNELTSYLEGCLDECVKSGNVEGLVITGLSSSGIKLLQSFVDRTGDVQTAALVVSRVVFPSNSKERRISAEWIEVYRHLLNTWQMWQSRALFDVDRGEMLRRLKARDTENGIVRRVQMRKAGSRTAEMDILPSVPAAVDARCNYCASPLGLRNHEGVTNQWLSKLKPILSCCPQCRKPLPRCAVCLLGLGVINPHTELTKERSRMPTRNGNPTKPMSDLASLPVAEWFTWCMACKHGGHTQHLVDWFSRHDTCPVSGCECQCQFDGIHRLSRPALQDNSLPQRLETLGPTEKLDAD